MFKKNKTKWNSARIRQLTDIRNVGLYIFAVIVLAITWSGVKTVQNNYELQKQISTLRQQNSVLGLQNANMSLQNEYLQTNQYLELAARQNFGLAAPGETVLLIPKSVAMKYIDPSLAVSPTTANNANTTNGPTGVAKNLEDWRDFLLGRKLFSD
ncbi:MAG: septum formation initiator family protein [Candidatus Saccharimonadales bacterium]|jgi:cell division protein FtsB